jgi:DnaJ-domain-containing protein 1
VKEPLWQRVRRHKKADEADPRDDAATLAVETDVAVDDESMLPRLTDLAATGDKKAEYADWVERMKAKRAEKVDSVRKLAADGTPVTEGEASYWSPDAVWEESRRLQSEGGHVVASRLELLAVLGLGADATDADITASYRRQAKEHHPDRFPHADDATRALHVEQMQRLTAAYRALLA